MLSDNQATIMNNLYNTDQNHRWYFQRKVILDPEGLQSHVTLEKAL